MTQLTPPTNLATNVRVSGRHVDVGDALRSRIGEELAAGVGKYFDRGGTAEVVVSRDGHAFAVDAVVTLASGQQLVARGLGGDAHGAFDAAMGKIETRVRRYKRRLKNHHQHPGGRQAETASYVVLRTPADEEEVDTEWEAEESTAAGPPAGAIIAETEASVKTMTVSMAVMELDLIEAPLVLFRNVAHGGLSVVYRRGDGNIGWIDPERTRGGAAAA